MMVGRSIFTNPLSMEPCCQGDGMIGVASDAGSPGFQVMEYTQWKFEAVSFGPDIFGDYRILTQPALQVAGRCPARK